MAEDDEVSGLVAAKLLQIAGAKAWVVGDGEQALKALSLERFDLVLMDVQMPVLDGVEATKSLRAGHAGAHAKDLPVIAMTAYAMAGDKETFLAAGMNSYVAKPATINELVRAVQEVLGRAD